jgi:cysteine-rich repeat protein
MASSEQCDDSNLDDGDGCSSSCLIEAEYQCDGSTTQSPEGSNSVCAKSCGDGAKYAAHYSEQCDDGNLVSGDGCDSSCQIENLYECDGSTTSGTETALSVCVELPAVCGDTFVSGSEICDSVEGCADDCLGPKEGYSCENEVCTQNASNDEATRV